MGISGIASTNSMSVMQMTSADLKDHKSKNIQNEITEVQQQIQNLSSTEELSANEKADERKKLQKEKSSLDNELKQHQEELLHSQKREAMLAELREAQNPVKREDDENGMTAEASASQAEKENPTADEQQAQPLQPGTVISQSSDGTVILKEVMNPTENNSTSATETEPADETKEAVAAAEETEPAEEETGTDPAAEFRPTANEMQAMVSSDTSSKMADRMGMLITKTNDGIALLKGEIKQDAYYGTDTERKEAELADMQKQQKREMAVQFSMLGEAGNTMKAAFDTESANSAVQNDTGKHFQVSGLRASQQEEQALQQGF